MSRYFDANSNLVITPSFPVSSELAAITLACWVLVTDYGPVGIPAIAKDMNGVYLPFLGVDVADGALFCEAGAPCFGGFDEHHVAAGGTGYNVGDTGVVIGGDPDTPANEAQYTVLTVDGSNHVLSVSFSISGQGYAVGSTYATVRGGSQPGLGSGLTITADALLNQSPAYSHSDIAVSLGVWVHIAMTWDSAGDGLIRLYINGVETGYADTEERTVSFTPSSDSGGGWFFGADAFGDAGAANIKQVAIFNQALTAAQMQALAALPNSVQGVADNNLVAYWPLTSANPEVDLSGNGADGAITTVIPPASNAATTPLVSVVMETPVESSAITS